MTIYALSSGPGLSGIAVIRVSGSDTLKVLKKLTYLPIPDPKVASLRKFINPKTKEVSYLGETATMHFKPSKSLIKK